MQHREYAMSETPKVVNQMFASLVNLPLDQRVTRQAAAVVDGLIEKLMAEMPDISKGDWRKLRIALSGMLAHGWAMGMNPFNNPCARADGSPLEVRVSKDILLPMETIKSLRYVKKDTLGRVEKAFFEPSAEVKIKEQIDRILTEIARKHWTK
jgi:hypothetical protein